MVDTQPNPRWDWGWQFWTPIALIVLAGAISTILLRGGRDWLHEWETLIAGGLGLGGGVLAYIGIKAQIADLQAERKQTDDRRRIVVKWAVRMEGQRLDKEVVRVRPAFLKSFDPTPTTRFFNNRTSFLIESSPLLRGEREDVALLDGDIFKTLEKAAETLNSYTQRIETASTGAASLDELPERGRELLEHLATLADTP
jgi:hypothetical protein